MGIFLTDPVSLSERNRFLLIEDDPDLQTLLVRGLKSRLELQDGCLLVCDGPEQAFQTFEEHQKSIGAVLTDMRMPHDGAGLEVYHYVRSKQPPIPIGFMSGGMSEENQETMNQILLKDKMTKYLPKPLYAARLDDFVSWFQKLWLR